MIYCKELDISFKEKEEMFLALKTHENDILTLKKAQTYKSHEKGQFSPINSLDISKLDESVKASFHMKDGYFYPITNTTNYMDSHGDVHFPNLWNKSLKDNSNHFYYVADHDLAIKSVIAYPKDVRVFTKNIDWRLIGKDYEGTTHALIFEIPIDKIQLSEAKKVIAEKIDIQNSVRMQYVKIFFAANSNHKDLAENKALYDEYIGQIANKEYVEEQGYFYGVTEAKIIRECSMVLFGSNDATPIMYKQEAAKDSTSIEIEPSEDTQTKTLSIYEMMTIVNQKFIN